MGTRTLTLNSIEFEYGRTILEEARDNEIDIPTLCHLAGTTPTGACYICLVEVDWCQKLDGRMLHPGNGRDMYPDRKKGL